MKAKLFNSIMQDAKEEDLTVIIVFDVIHSCGGYSSTNSSVELKAQDVYETNDYIQFEIDKVSLLSVQPVSGTVFVEYENIKMVIVKG